MLRDVDMQDASTIVADDEEAVEHSERDRWHCEEIHGGNRFPMIAKEGQPALGLIRTSRRTLHPTGDGSLGKIKTEHAEFPMVKKLEWIEMAQLAVSSILFKSLSLKLP
jgi:hypothetical protein